MIALWSRYDPTHNVGMSEERGLSLSATVDSTLARGPPLDAL